LLVNSPSPLFLSAITENKANSYTFLMRLPCNQAPVGFKM